MNKASESTTRVSDRNGRQVSLPTGDASTPDPVIQAIVDSCDSNSSGLRDRIVEHLTQCRRALGLGLFHILKVGGCLCQAKAEVEHGQWGKWLADNFAPTFGLDERTAQVYIRLYRGKDQLIQELRRTKAQRAALLQNDDAFLEGVSIREAQRILSDGHPNGKPSRDFKKKASGGQQATGARVAAPTGLGVLLASEESARNRPAGESVEVEPTRGWSVASWEGVEEAIDQLVIAVADDRVRRGALVVPLVPSASWFSKVTENPVLILRDPVDFTDASDPLAAASRLHPALLMFVVGPEDYPALVAACRPLGQILIPLCS